MVTNKRRLTTKNIRSKRKSRKISGAGAGSSAMPPPAMHSRKMHSRRPRSVPTKTHSAPRQNMSRKSNRHLHLGVLRNNSAPAILPTQLKAFKTTDELKQAIKDYFTNQITRDTVITEYGNISDWNTSQITDMSNLFREIKPLAGDNLIQLNWDTSNVTNMSHMFFDCSLNFKINFTNTSKVTDMSYMFAFAEKFNQELPESFDTSNVITMSHMFLKATIFNQPLPESFNTSKVTDMYSMFSRAEQFNQKLNFDTRNVTTMGWMFYDATNFNQPIRFVTNITNFNGLSEMFMYTRNLESPISIQVKFNLLQPRINEHIIFNGSKITHTSNNLKFNGSKITHTSNNLKKLKITEHEISFF